jgi:putative selenium metabolism hydrolase
VTTESDLLRFAQRLVRTPSLPGEEAVVARMVADELDRLGYRDVMIDHVGNVIGWLGDGPPRLMWNGHLDHVPPADMDSPYEGEIDWASDGTAEPALRGRGSCDMKASVAAGVYAAAFLTPGTKLSGSYVFTGDVQEETDSPLGIQAMLATGLRAEFGISGESTNLEVSVGHRGKALFDLVVQGRAAHSSSPAAGSNAIYNAVPFLRALHRANESLPADDLFGKATLVVTRISSEPEGDVAMVPSSCTLRIDRRYLPSETPEGCLNQLERLMFEVSRREGIEASIEPVSVYPAMTIDPNHPLVRAGLATVEAVTGIASQVCTWQFGVNATFMSAAGIPSIGIGPGSETWAHTAAEHVPVAHLAQASRIYAGLIERLCV